MSETPGTGARLKQLRTRLGVGQVDFARAIGVPQSNLSPWETGKRSVPMPVLLAACAIYGASKAWLVDGIGPMFEVELNLSAAVPPPDGGIYLEDLAGVLQAIKRLYRIGGEDLLRRSLPEGRYHSIVRGHDLPTFAEIGTIARVLGVPVQQLLVLRDGSPIVKDLKKVDPLAPILPRRSPAVLDLAEADALSPSKNRKREGDSAIAGILAKVMEELERLRTEVEALKSSKKRKV